MIIIIIIIMIIMIITITITITIALTTAIVIAIATIITIIILITIIITIRNGAQTNLYTCSSFALGFVETSVAPNPFRFPILFSYLWVTSRRSDR